MMRFAGLVLLAVQTVALLVLLARLFPGRSRRPPVEPVYRPRRDTSVSVIVATLNEAHRIGPCLDGLTRQIDPLLEVLVVDSNSTDGTRELVASYAARDRRIRLITDEPLPEGWVGKVWALETGLRHARGVWVLGIDADTVPAPGLVGAVVQAVEQDGFDVASFGPQFTGQSTGERWVQPAMLVTLVYRCGAAGATQPAPNRVLANGQCFVARRDLLVQHGGYAPARASFSDDVTLARHLAARGARVGFLDGSRIIAVRSYASLGEMWREWGRSFDLKDATPRWRRWFDVMLVWSMQAIPLPALIVIIALMLSGARSPVDSFMPSAPDMLLEALALVNASALLVRGMLLVALRGNYAERGVAFWCSWLADIPAAWRLTLSTLRVPRAWRGRSYAGFATGDT
ncbi:MAG: glycosyltransferase family 2 protein [Gemmatimonadota bacterium]